MGTHSLIYFQERRNGQTAIYVVIYQHWDGYLAGAGITLAKFLKKVMLVSRMEIGHEAESKEGRIICHGFGDLVARFIRKFRFQYFVCEAVPGGKINFYGLPDYVYYVTNTDEGIQVQVDGICSKGCEAPVEMIGEYLSAEMSIDKFMQICGSKRKGLPIYDIPPPQVQLVGNILSWTQEKEQFSFYTLQGYEITARAGPGTMPLRITVGKEDTEYDLNILDLNMNTPYEIVVNAEIDDHGQLPPSNAVMYQRSSKQCELSYRPNITGTRSLIFFEDAYKGIHAVIYQQWGGDLDGVGHTLATFLVDAKSDKIMMMMRINSASVMVLKDWWQGILG